MTEQELNLKVAEIIGFDLFESPPCGGSVGVCRYGFPSTFNWCDDDSGWSKLARVNRIDIAHQDNGMVFAGAGKCSDDFYAYEATDEEIGVAVVKCFLMMNGVEL